MQLSVIVPVYKVEKFLPRCLDSLLRQGMQKGEWEVICVNDGSPDGSARILSRYRKEHPDIFKVINQENQGLGGARNTGTAQAKGEYVAYLDSDDYFVDGALRFLLDRFCQDKPDVLCFDNHCVYTDGVATLHANTKPSDEVPFEGDGAEAYNRWPLPHVWSKLYKRSFLEQHHIESEIVICQDEVFNFAVFRNHPFTRVVESKVVCYEVGNSGSIQRLTNKEIVLVQLQDLIYNIGLMRKYIESGKTELLPAAHRNIDNFLNVYYRKIQQSERLTKDEWMRYRKLTKKYSFSAEKRKEKRPFRAQLLLWMFEWAGTSWVGYSTIHFVRETLFKKIYYPLVIARGKKVKS